MKTSRLFTLILPLLLTLCASTEASASTPSGSISSANTSITTRDKNGNLLPSFLRIQYDVDSDGRVQNVKILESTTTPELEHQVIDKMIKKWRFEKGKPGIAQRLVVKIPPKSDGDPANKQ
ncbi:TonB family protein [Klebsiella quasipneumoniae]|uniref:TonB family protein n=1 Tax=Klebsiella quasipneumoniae TaxID=1463165 RepID=UPI002ABBD0FE|nr:TonB family protein [Klebsiella quasipneumoniae]MDZ0182723.1 TonB family protein [Klebsiella quasipneumoniae]